MQEIIRHQDEFYILATSPRVDDRTRVLKHGETFALLDRFGEIDPFGGGELGLYHEGTRFLSRWTIRIDEVRPALLSSTVKERNDLLTVDLTNYDISAQGRVILPHGSLHLFRSRFLWGGASYERVRIRSYGVERARVVLDVDFDADFRDIFEVRGVKRSVRGDRLPDEVSDSLVVMSYRGRDGIIRRCRLEWNPAPQELRSGKARYSIELSPGEETELFIVVRCEIEGSAGIELSYDEASRRAESEHEARTSGGCRIYTSNEQFNDWLHRSRADLLMMLTETPEGLYPYAGVPWFSTPFGRDGILTALETLWVDPDVSRGVLSYLAATQATELVPEQDAEPGKILHETRGGEMANLGEIPFRRYYGTVDATPLFVVLASEYLGWTGDVDLVRSIWPNLERAISWMDEFGDADKDGFIEYWKKSAHGLVHQGWKDSQDSVFHADGRDPEGPIALSEVQGYAYAAKKGAARIARRLGRVDRADELARQADALRLRFEEAFWLEDLGTYALALDGETRACRVRSSNPGHCLFTAISTPARAERVMETLLSEASFSGWGIRTLSAGEPRYNPMSYHNGSVWPHDNAIIASGFARYGFRDAVLRVFGGLFDASLFVDLHRLPELFCGFVRRAGEGPTLYPVACAPQAWAAGSVFLLLRACLGLSVHGRRRQLRFERPFLPPWLENLEITNLRVGDAVVDVRVDRYERDAGVEVTRRHGDADVVVVK